MTLLRRKIDVYVFFVCACVTVSLSKAADTASVPSQPFTVPIVKAESNDEYTPLRPNFAEETRRASGTPPMNNRHKIQVEDILKEIFEAEFDDEPIFGIQNDAVVPATQSTASNASIVVVDSDLNTTREGRAEFHQNRNRRRKGQTRNEKNRKRQQALAQKKAQEFRKTAAQQNRQGGKIQTKNGAKTPALKGKGLDLAKYNAYMDAVLNRMNALIRKKRMDPLRVNLYSGPSPGQKKGQGQGQNKGQANKKGQGFGSNKNGGKTKKKGGARWDEDDSGSKMASEEEDDDNVDSGDSGDRDESGEDEGRSVREYTLIKSNVFQRRMRALENATESDSDGGANAPTVPEGAEGEGRGKVKSVTQKPGKGQNTEEKKKGKGNGRAPLPPKRRNSPRPTRGVLHGLSSLRRDGNVQIVKDGEKARIIRSRFLLGPVALEILPKKTKKKSSREDLSDDEVKTDATPAPPAATATAPQLKGILEIRLSPGKPTRIRRLRVFPPGNIQVDGDKRNDQSGMRRAAGYRKVTPMATARLRQTAIQVLRQVDNKMKTKNRRGGQGLA